MSLNFFGGKQPCTFLALIVRSFDSKKENKSLVDPFLRKTAHLILTNYLPHKDSMGPACPNLTYFGENLFWQNLFVALTSSLTGASVDINSFVEC